jgi:hypothetical protein
MLQAFGHDEVKGKPATTNPQRMGGSMEARLRELDRHLLPNEANAR